MADNLCLRLENGAWPGLHLPSKAILQELVKPERLTAFFVDDRAKGIFFYQG